MKVMIKNPNLFGSANETNGTASEKLLNTQDFQFKLAINFIFPTEIRNEKFFDFFQTSAVPWFRPGSGVHTVDRSAYKTREQKLVKLITFDFV